MFKISSIIIAKDEEVNIAKCIDSQLDSIDEIIVLVDKKSSDKTLEIIKNYNNVIYEVVEWMGYSKTKQYGVDKASNNWIFWIDADEAIMPALAEEMNKFKNTEPQYSVYNIARRAYFLGKWIKHSGWYPGRVNRLFDRTKAKFSDSEVHEHLVFNGGVGNLKNDLEHYTDPNIEHYFLKFNHYTSLAASELNAKGKFVTVSDILIRPAYLFIKMYLLRRGFLDGFHGFILAIFSSMYVFTKYTKLWELNRKGKLK